MITTSVITVMITQSSAMLPTFHIISLLSTIIIIIITAIIVLNTNYCHNHNRWQPATRETVINGQLSTITIIIILIVIIILALNHYNNKNNNYHRDHNSRPPHRQTVPRQQQDEELCDHRSRKVTCPGPDKTRFFTVFVNIVLYCHSYMTDVVVLILAPQIQIVPVESSHCRFVGFVFGFSSLSVSLCFVFVYVFLFCHFLLLSLLFLFPTCR